MPSKRPLAHPQAALDAVKSPISIETDPGPLAQSLEQLTPEQAMAVNASVPFSTLPIVPARSFKMPTANAIDSARALTCLTMAVYYEAATQSDDGQAAVAQVVLNRVRNPMFPKTVCGVVFQGSKLPTGCQFTFTCDGSLSRIPSQAGWMRAQQVAQRALNGFVMKSVGDSTHYHTQWVVPYWQPTLVKLTQVGAHIFYRWSGGEGLPQAFSARYAGSELEPPQIPGFVAGPPIQLVDNASTHSTPVGAAASKGPDSAQSQPIHMAELAMPQVDPVSMSQPSFGSALDKPKSYFGHEREDDSRLPVATNQ